VYLRLLYGVSAENMAAIVADVNRDR